MSAADGAIRVSHCDAVAIRKSGVVAWRPYKYESAGDDCIITGGIPKVLASGPRKGRYTWNGCKSTMVVVTRSELAAEEAEYAAITGNCHRCYGDGQVFHSWHYISGATYRKCIDCDGIGKAARNK